jgi:hypothetical protein
MAQRLDTLLYCLLHVLLGRIELLLKELDFSYQAVIGGLTGFPLIQSNLVVGQFAFRLFEFTVEEGKLVFERVYLLFFLEEFQFIFLVLVLCCFRTFSGGICFGTEGSEFL